MLMASPVDGLGHDGMHDLRWVGGKLGIPQGQTMRHAIR